jgi:hypothetical protein
MKPGDLVMIKEREGYAQVEDSDTIFFHRPARRLYELSESDMYTFEVKPGCFWFGREIGLILDHSSFMFLILTSSGTTGWVEDFELEVISETG